MVDHFGDVEHADGGLHLAAVLTAEALEKSDVDGRMAKSTTGAMKPGRCDADDSC
jgi:hypothetical protein